MTVQWSTEQERQVKEILDNHPAGSGECAVAADKILPIGSQLDEAAAILEIRPSGNPRARYVLAKIGGQTVYWFRHFTVEVLAHCVDALPGSGGHPKTTYLSTYFEYPQCCEMRPPEREVG